MRPTFTSFESMAASTRLLEQIVQSMIEGCSALFGVPASTLQSLVEQYEPKPPPPPEEEAEEAMAEDGEVWAAAPMSAGEGAEDAAGRAEFPPAASAGTARTLQSSEAAGSSGDDADGATTPLLSPASTTTVTDVASSPIDGLVTSPQQHLHPAFPVVGLTAHTAPPTQPPPPPPPAKVSPAFSASPTAKPTSLPSTAVHQQQQQQQPQQQTSFHAASPVPNTSSAHLTADGDLPGVERRKKCEI